MAVDQGVRPTISSIVNEKASIVVNKTRAVFQSSTVTYNETGLTYNDANTFYGGHSGQVADGPTIGEINNIKSILGKVGN